jgi:hypothetical protein
MSECAGLFFQTRNELCDWIPIRDTNKTKLKLMVNVLTSPLGYEMNL